MIFFSFSKKKQKKKNCHVNVLHKGIKPQNFRHVYWTIKDGVSNIIFVKSRYLFFLNNFVVVYFVFSFLPLV